MFASVALSGTWRRVSSDECPRGHGARDSYHGLLWEGPVKSREQCKAACDDSAASAVPTNEAGLQRDACGYVRIKYEYVSIENRGWCEMYNVGVPKNAYTVDQGTAFENCVFQDCGWDITGLLCDGWEVWSNTPQWNGVPGPQYLDDLCVSDCNIMRQFPSQCYITWTESFEKYCCTRLPGLESSELTFSHFCPDFCPIFTMIGDGHCVDDHNRRPAHCWGSVEDKSYCEQLCAGDALCVAYEYGQNWGGILCQLIYVTLPSSCPDNRLHRGSSQGGTSVTRTFHITGGSCYLKQQAGGSLEVVLQMTASDSRVDDSVPGVLTSTASGGWTATAYSDYPVTDSVTFKCTHNHIMPGLQKTASTTSQRYASLDYGFCCRPSGTFEVFENGAQKYIDTEVYGALTSVLELRIVDNNVQYIVDGRVAYVSTTPIADSESVHFACSFHDHPSQVTDIAIGSTLPEEDSFMQTNQRLKEANKVLRQTLKSLAEN